MAMERRVRKVTVYVCTDCYAPYPSKEAAQEHFDREHPQPTTTRPRGRPRKNE